MTKIDELMALAHTCCILYSARGEHEGEAWEDLRIAIEQALAMERASGYEAGLVAEMETREPPAPDAQPVAWMTKAAWGDSVSLEKPDFGKAEWKAPQPTVVPLYLHPQ